MIPPSASSSSRLSTATTNTPNTTPWHSPDLSATPKRYSASSYTPTSTSAGQSSANAHSWGSEPNKVRRTRTSLSSLGAPVAAELRHSSDVQMVGSRSGSRSIPARRVDGDASDPSQHGTMNREQWWESVVPPGLLAERLRRAQAGSAGTLEADTDEGPRHSRKSILRSSVEGHGSERSMTATQTGLPRSISTEAGTYLSPPSSAVSRARAGTWSSHSSSLSSYPPSSTRSSISIGELSSASSSNDDSPTDRRSPSVEEGGPFGFGDRGSGATSPTSITRSQSNRRRRIVGSDDGMGLGVSIRGAKSNVIDLDERLRQWNNGMPFYPASSGQAQSTNNAPTLGLQPFPSARQGASSSPFSDTPEGSSEEEFVSFNGTRRSVRTSSTHTNQTLRDIPGIRKGAVSGATAPSSRRSSLTSHGHSLAADRRVSFNQDVEVLQSNDVKRVQTIGRAHGRSYSSLSDKHGHGPVLSEQSRPSQRINANVSRAQHPEVRAHAHSHIRGKRTPCHSAPTSPQMHAQSLYNERGPSRLRHDARKAETNSSSSRANTSKTLDSDDTPAADLAVLSSLGAAHAQLTSARNLAMALTRQLSAPLRPVLHLTLLASISGMAFIALTGFLVAGYMCTVWDDVNSRGKSLQQNVSSARKTIESRVHWTRKMLGIQLSESDAPPMSAEAKSTDSRPSNASASAKKHAHSASQSTSKIFTAPLRFALTVPGAILYSLTPDGVRQSFSDKRVPDTKAAPHSFAASTSSTHAGGHRRSASRSSTSGPQGFHTLPPRPPLSSLLPSIALTIVIAFGAGLASFFANRAATETGSARSSPASSPSSPLLHSSRPSTSGRVESTHSTKAQPASFSSHTRRRSAKSSLASGSSASIHSSPGEGRRSPFAWQEVSAL